MKQVIYSRFGDESILEIAERPVPAIKENEILIRVKAVSINPLDWKIYQGEMKLMSGSKFPRQAGIDFSAIVEKRGNAVQNFKEKDEVLGLTGVFKGGALAEYLVVKESEIALKPANISFEQAAALPVVGLSALQIADQLANIRKDQELLINGAAGGVGMLLIQFAKARGARVTAMVSAAGMAAAKTWGADAIMDYKLHNIRKLEQKFDAVIDLSTTLMFKDVRKLLKHDSVFVSTLATPAVLLASFVHNLFSKKKFKVLLLKPAADQLKALSQLAKGKLEITLHKSYPFANLQEAYRESRQGHIIGKSVIRVD